MLIESVTQAAALLYGEPLSTFIAARTTMEKEARAAGDRVLAGQIKALRKPSVIAAELNVVAREDPGAVEALLEAAADLGEGQQQMAAGEDVDFVSLQNCYRSAVHALVELADGQRQSEVRSAIEATAVEPGLHQKLRSGTFVEAPQQIGSFGMAMPESDLAARSKQRTRKPPAKDARPAPPVADLRLVRAAKKKVEAATNDNAAAKAALDEAESVLRLAEERAEALEAEVEMAQAERRQAEESVEAAEREATRSAAEVAKAKEALEHAVSS